MRRRRFIRHDKLLGLTTSCPECGGSMRSTGEALHDDGVEGWAIGFHCSRDEDFAIWKPAWQGLLDEVTRGVDPSTLPRWGRA